MEEYNLIKEAILSIPQTVIIIGPAYPYKGGISNFTERLAMQFKNEGYIVTIYSFSFLYPTFLFPGKDLKIKERNTYSKDLEILNCINSINPLNWWKVANSIVMLERPDILVVNYWLPLLAPCLGTIMRLIKRKCNTLIVGIAHNIVPHEKRLFDNLFTKFFCKPIMGWITLSENVMNDLRKFEPTINIKPIN